MTSQFMPRRLNGSHQRWVALRDPTHYKKGAVEMKFLQQFKHFVCVPFNAGLHVVPLSVRD